MLYEYIIMVKVNKSSQQELVSCCFFYFEVPCFLQHKVTSGSPACRFQLASPPGFQATHIPKGNLRYTSMNIYARRFYLL